MNSVVDLLCSLYSNLKISLPILGFHWTEYGSAKMHSVWKELSIKWVIFPLSARVSSSKYVFAYGKDLFDKTKRHLKEWTTGLK